MAFGPTVRKVSGNSAMYPRKVPPCLARVEPNTPGRLVYQVSFSGSPATARPRSSTTGLEKSGRFSAAMVRSSASTAFEE